VSAAKRAHSAGFQFSALLSTLFFVSSFPDLKLLYGLPILQSKFDHFFLQGGKAEQESLQVLHIPFFVLIILAMALICFKRRNTLKNKKGNTAVVSLFAMQILSSSHHCLHGSSTSTREH
jgi:hypothetical protein